MKREQVVMTDWQLVCTSCVEEKKERTQENMPELSSLVGKWVKVPFATGRKSPSVENMWVRVDKVNEKFQTFSGKLDSVPVFAALSLNDQIKHRSVSEIIEVYEG